MKNCNCKETEITTLCKPDPCNCVCKMPVDECTNKVVYYITLASAVLMSCNSEETVEHVLNLIRNDLENLNYITNDDAWRALIEKIKAHISDLNSELIPLIDNRIGEIVNLNGLIKVFNTLFEEWKALLNGLISQASTIVLDDEVTENSSNGVKSSGIYAAINSLPLPDWKEIDSTLHSYIRNKPTKLSDFENDLSIGIAASDITDETRGDVTFTIKAKNYTGTGNWNYMDAAVLLKALDTKDADAYQRYVNTGDAVNAVNAVINYILNLWYYPVIVTPKKLGELINSGIYYDISTDRFFNLKKDDHDNYTAKYLKRGPVNFDGEIVIGALAANKLNLNYSETSNLYKFKESATDFNIVDPTTISICLGKNYITRTEDTYPVSNLAEYDVTLLQVNGLRYDKLSGCYIGSILGNIDTTDLDDPYLTPGNNSYTIRIDKSSGICTLISQLTLNEH